MHIRTAQIRQNKSCI